MNARATALVLGALAVGCSPARGSAFKLSMAEATRANGAGRDAEAAQAFERAAATARVPGDAAFARQEAALAWLRAGDETKGLAGLRALAADKNQYSAAAQYKLAEYNLRKGDPRAAADLEAFLVAHPDTGYARAAFVKVLRGKETDAEALAWLAALRPRVAGTDLEQRVAYEHARRLERSERSEEAREEYLRIADRWPYPKGVHFDEALVHAAALSKAAGQPKVAIALLERLLAQRESAHVMGTYEKVAYAEAAFEIARIHEDPLHDRAAARAAYHRVYRDFRTATVRDDALWRESRLWEADGHRDEKCATLRTLVRDFPDSRYVPCAVSACSIARPKNSGAPATCHDYLSRTP